MGGAVDPPEFFPGRFAKASAVFISGPSRTLLKWFAFAALQPYASRVYWTDVRLPGEVLDPLDPMALQVVPEKSVYVLSPRELAPDDQGALRAEAAAATMIHSDDRMSNLRGLVEFLRMPAHAQDLISTTGRPELPSILVTANSQRLATVYSVDRIAGLMKALLDAGTCQVALWSEAQTTHTSMFDVILHVEGSGPPAWRDATVRCEKGMTAGPLAKGDAVSLSSLPSISTVLEKSIPSRV